MAVDRQRLERHLQDYRNTTGHESAHFVCPVTLRRCEESELVDGHILNRKLRKASRTTVIQYGSVDSFYGARVEPDMVQFLNMVDSDGTRLSKHFSASRVIFSDGSAARAFPTNAKAAQNAGSGFTSLDVATDRGRVRVLAEAAPNDPRWAHEWQLEGSRRFLPAHWTAAMLKAGYLCWFNMFGYRAVYSPFGDTLRRTLASFYDVRATKEDAHLYFGDFRNAVKILMRKNTDGDEGIRWDPLRFDTLTDSIVLLHHSLSGTLFAVTCLFAINGVTASVTLPEGLDGPEAATVWILYSRYMANPAGLEQRVHRARFTNDRCEVEQTPTDVRFVDALPGQ